MTLATIKSTGLGRLRQRIRLEGLAVDLVSSEDMEQATDSSGRERLCCISRPVTKISEKMNPIDVIADGSGATVKAADVDEKLSAVFGCLPSKTTWLLSDAGSSDTTLTVGYSGDWSANDIGYVGMETIKIGGTGAGTMTTVSRGHWQSAARAHYTSDGEHAQFVEVADKPRTFVGRHVWVYQYGDGDDPQGDGALGGTWTGVLAADPMLEADGVTWSFKIKPTTITLGQTLGVGLGEPVSLRGIRYTPANALRIQLAIGTTANEDWSLGTDQAEITIGVTSAVHYETQAEFCTALTAAFTAAIAGFSNTPIVQAVPDPIAGWRLAVTIDATTARFVYVTGGGQMDGFLDSRIRDDSGDPITTVSTGDDGTIGWHDGGATRNSRHVPRGHLGGSYLAYPGAPGPASSDPAGLRAFISEASPLPAAGDSVVIDGGDWGASGSASVVSSDSTTRSVLLSDMDPAGVFYSREQPITLTYGRTYVDSGSLADLVSALIADSVTETNKGLAPAITGDDMTAATWASVIAEAAAGRPYLVGRTYRNGGEIELGKLFAAEMAVAGVVLGFDSSGAMIPIVVKVYVSTDGDVATLTPVGRVPRPTFAPKGLGALRGAIVKTGYVATRDEWDGATVRVLDAKANALNPAASLKDIEPRSERIGDAVEDIREGMRSLIGLMGAPYAIRRVTSGLQAMDYVLGDGISVTHAAALNWQTGSRDGSAFVGTVVAREVDFQSGLVTLDLLVPGESYVGWAPAVGVTATADQGGDKWLLTVQFGDPWSVDTGWSADALSDHYATNDAVEIYDVGTASPTVLTGTVTQVGAATLAVAFSGTFTPSTQAWVLRPQTAASVQTGQEAYCHLADDTRQVAFATAIAARVVGP